MNLAVLKVILILAAAGLAHASLLGRAERPLVMRKLLWLLPGLFMAGMLVPNIYVLIALLIALPPIISRTKGEAAAIWLIMLLSVPRISMKLQAGSMSLLDLDSHRCINIGFLIAVLLKPGPRAPLRGRMDLPVILFLMLQLFVDLRSISINEAIRNTLMDGMTIAVPYFALTRAIATTNDIRRMALALVFGAGVQSIMALFQVYEHWPTYEMINGHLGIKRMISQSSKMRAGMMRGNGSFLESTAFSWFLALAMTALVLSRDLYRSAAAWWAAIAVLWLGLAVAQSREGWMAAIIGILLANLYRGRAGYAAAIAGVIGMVGAALVVVAQNSERLSEAMGLSGGSAETLDYRQLLLARGLEEITQHPLMGRAPDVVVQALSDIRQGEGIVDFVNGYIYYGLVAGVIGVVAIIAVFLTIIVGTMRRQKIFRTHPDYLRAGGLAFAVAIFTMISTFTSGLSDQIVMFVFITVALSSAASGMASRRPGKTAIARNIPVTSGAYHI